MATDHEPVSSPGPGAVWEFWLELDPLPDANWDDTVEALYEAGCDDASVEWGPDGASAVFHREAATPEEAVLSAVEQAQRAGVTVLAVRNDDEVVIADIAERTGRTRQSVHQLVRGERGPGGFPAPLRTAHPTPLVFSWEEVERWFAQHDPAALTRGPHSPYRPLPRQVVELVNSGLRLRRQLPELPRELAGRYERVLLRQVLDQLRAS